MKRAFLALGLIALVSTKCFGSSDLATLNGNDWNEYIPAQKYAMVSGFMLAMHYIIVNTGRGLAFQGVGTDSDYKLYSSLLGKKEKKYSRDEVKKMLNASNITTDEAMASYRIANITNTQIVTGLDEVYKDFKNVQINLSDAIYYVRKQINGADEEELDATVRYLRNPNRSFGNLFYEGKNGKSKFINFP